MTPHAGQARQATAAVRTAGRGMPHDPVRPAAHLRPPAGWMNDPNGAIHLRGEYHVFYQHNPYGDRWGDIHWGHASSPDLVRWEHRPVALAPSPERGEAHCFTGSAWTRPDGTPVLFYSSFPADLSERPAEQWLVECDEELSTFRKWEGNPLLSLATHDGPALDPDWRDPFVFGAEDRTFLILGATLAASGAPVVPLYEARDDRLEDWSFRGILHRGDPDEYGFFECPTMIPVGDRHALLYSAHRPVEWILGRFDPDTASLEPEATGRLDRTANLYGTATVACAPGPHPVVVGWVRGWEPGRGWNGCLSLPRVIRPGPDGRPLQAPVAAVEGLREGDGVRREELRLRPESGSGSVAEPVEGLESATLELRARIAPGPGGAGIRLREGGDGDVVASLRLDPGGGRLEVTGPSHPLDLRVGEPPVAAEPEIREETTSVPLAGGGPGEVTLRLFWDRSLLEVFVQDGREVCTRVMAGDGAPVGVELFAEGTPARFEAVEGWVLEEIW